MIPWQGLNEELDRWHDAGLGLDVWLRDDDAIQPTVQLDHLLGLCRQFRIPVLLAVIPGLAGESLAARLSAEALVRPCQHGWRHINHAQAGQKSAEFGQHRPLEVMLNDIRAGRERFAALFPAHADNIFVPPWNRIAPELVMHLPELGFDSLSAFRPLARPGIAGLRITNPDIDIIDWRAGRILRQATDIEHEITALLAVLRPEGQPRAKLGLLLHHLVHEPGAWALLDSLLTVFARRTFVGFANPA